MFQACSCQQHAEIPEAQIPHVRLTASFCGVQLCQAYRNDGGKVVVILTRVPKLVIEATFRRTIPEDLRFGTTFVFRQGSVLVPGDLRQVAASAASSVVIISDRSRWASKQTGMKQARGLHVPASIHVLDREWELAWCRFSAGVPYACSQVSICAVRDAACRPACTVICWAALL